MSRLEKFIDNNREEFDDMPPPDGLWQKIEAGITKKKKKTFLLNPVIKWSVAAAVLIMIVAATFMLLKKHPAVEPFGIKISDTLTTNAVALAPEETPQMNEFAKMIALKQEELKMLAKEEPQLYQQFSKDITQLDSSYNTLKNKLNATPNRELLIEAMIQNLELQLKVLNQQLNIIHQIKQSKKPGHEKNKIYT